LIAAQWAIFGSLWSGVHRRTAAHRRHFEHFSGNSQKSGTRWRRGRKPNSVAQGLNTRIFAGRSVRIPPDLPLKFNIGSETMSDCDWRSPAPSPAFDATFSPSATRGRRSRAQAVTGKPRSASPPVYLPRDRCAQAAGDVPRGASAPLFHSPSWPNPEAVSETGRVISSSDAAVVWWHSTDDLNAAVASGIGGLQSAANFDDAKGSKGKTRVGRRRLQVPYANARQNWSVAASWKGHPGLNNLGSNFAFANRAD
jgi:hypothetical protein